MATKSELLARWNSTLETSKRDVILKELQAAHLFPADFTRQWEQDTGAYPSQSPDADYQDPLFLQKLLAKREFAESLQKKWTPDDEACGSTDFFEVTPVQRFAANLMSPRSPYMSALLYHGVGVGKTCAAVQVSEAWLHEYPKDKVFLITPPTIQEGFYKTMFNIDKVKFGTGDKDPNSTVGCTGNTYMELTGTLLERDPAKIQRRVDKAIRQRYRVTGYGQFANYVDKLIKPFRGLPDEERIEQEKRAISREFSGKLLIIDEAHNLRDILGTELEGAKKSKTDIDADEPIEAGGEKVKKDMSEGKTMTPFVQKVLKYSRGLKLVLLTATPMYNTYKEIIFLLNLLLANDKKAELTEKDIFTADGSFREGGEELLGRIASRYVSFMRGENPNSFPVRLMPEGVEVIDEYPLRTPRRGAVPRDETVFVEHLPIVNIPLPVDGDNYKASVALMGELTRSETDVGISPTMIKPIIQAGNFIAPATEEVEPGQEVRHYKDRLKPSAIEEILERVTEPSLTYKAREEGGAAFLALANLEQYSPKFVFLLKRLATCEGVAFVYSQFVEAGALPLALALEANGYKPYGRAPLLADGVQDGLGGQCALCPKRFKNHKAEGHSFVQATYGLLTGVTSLSPNNEATIQTEKSDANKEGRIMKVVIGSQIAAEGVDFRFIREVHVIDAWYHLNRTEQVIGRAIRYCSHAALDKEKRNTTIYLYATTYPDRSQETADLYSYRVAFQKAAKVGAVTRALKIRAIDCNLNHDAIVISGQSPKPQRDSQRKDRMVNINDMPYTAVCDWAERCSDECDPGITVDIGKSEDSTYSEFAAKWRESELKRRLQRMFEKQSFYEYAQLWDAFPDVPIAARTEFLSTVVDNKLFQVEHKGIKGYIKFCNKYFVIQPNVYMDLNIPLSIRMAKFPVRKDEYMPRPLERIEDEPVAPVAVATSSDFTLPIIWRAFKDWIEGSTGEAEFPEMPEAVSNRLDAMANGNTTILGKLRNIMEAIMWLHESIIESGGSMESYQKCVLEFLWDTLFSLDEQKSLVASGVQDMVAVNRLGTTIRYYNPANGENVYICKGLPCPAALVDDAKTQEEEARTSFMAQASGVKTGRIYGFTVSKEGTLYFKTNTPPKKSLGKGSICIIVTNMEGKYAKLLEMGDILRTAGKPDLELKATVVMAGLRKVENAVRGCTLMELVLRYMDAERINGLRWFYRAAEARALGHRGIFPLLAGAEEKTTATVAAAVKKESKKRGKVVVTKQPVAEAVVALKKLVSETGQSSTKAIAESSTKAIAESSTTQSSTKPVSVTQPLKVLPKSTVSVTKADESFVPESVAPVSKKPSLVSVTKAAEAAESSTAESLTGIAPAIQSSTKAALAAESLTKAALAAESLTKASQKGPVVSVKKVDALSKAEPVVPEPTAKSLVSVTKAASAVQSSTKTALPAPSLTGIAPAVQSLTKTALPAPSLTKAASPAVQSSTGIAPAVQSSTGIAPAVQSSTKTAPAVQSSTKAASAAESSTGIAPAVQSSTKAASAAESSTKAPEEAPPNLLLKAAAASTAATPKKKLSLREKAAAAKSAVKSTGGPTIISDITEEANSF